LVFSLVPSMVRDLESQVGAVVSKQLVLLRAVLMVFSSTATTYAREVPAPQKEVEMTLSLSSTAFKLGFVQLSLGYPRPAGVTESINNQNINHCWS